MAKFRIYTVFVDDQDCIVADEILISYGDPDDSSFELTANCDGSITAIITGLEGGVFSFEQDPEDGAIIDPDTGTVTGGLNGSTYNVVYTTNDACPSTSSSAQASPAPSAAASCEYKTKTKTMDSDRIDSDRIGQRVIASLGLRSLDRSIAREGMDHRRHRL